MARNYWMFVQTSENFEITKERGFDLYGLNIRQRRRAQRMEPDDRILFYISGERKWPATATIISKYFEDSTPIWKSRRGSGAYPYRVKISPSIVLDEKDYIDALELGPRLEYLKKWAPDKWPLAFVETLHLLPQKDFRLIEGEMKRLTSKKPNKKRSPKSELANRTSRPTNTLRESNGSPPEKSGTDQIRSDTGDELCRLPTCIPYDDVKEVQSIQESSEPSSE